MDNISVHFKVALGLHVMITFNKSTSLYTHVSLCTSLLVYTRIVLRLIQWKKRRRKERKKENGQWMKEKYQKNIWLNNKNKIIIALKSIIK